MNVSLGKAIKRLFDGNACFWTVIRPGGDYKLRPGLLK
jgi:hypothetical protein